MWLIVMDMLFVSNRRKMLSLLKQKFDSFTLVNLTGGKSRRISKANRNTVGFFASVNNLFDIETKQVDLSNQEKQHSQIYKQI